MRRSRLDVRVREEEKEDWRKAAKKEGIAVSELVRRQMLPYTSRATQKLVESDRVVHSA